MPVTLGNKYSSLFREDWGREEALYLAVLRVRAFFLTHMHTSRATLFFHRSVSRGLIFVYVYMRFFHVLVVAPSPTVVLPALLAIHFHFCYCIELGEYCWSSSKRTQMPAVIFRAYVAKYTQPVIGHPVVYLL